ncbi:RHS repeat-associated core domain-containing protein [Actinomadura sp. 9N215]|uniref:RHS repeat-associated core domain-containing protein n=1 Tax=Actinomadura sp. 9N215 TaxID=3375150 RepID=UPI003789F787
MPHLATLDWDPDNRLSRADLGGGGNAHYQYDAAGQRVRATIRKGGITETRVYLGLSERYQKTVNGTLRTERRTLHVMDGVRRVAAVETTTVDTGLLAAETVHRYQLSDHLGSVTVEVDGNCAVLSYEEYHPYGTTSFHAAKGAAEVSLKRYRFTGKEKDAETGFTYHGSRYYAPWLGRWTAPDPAGLVDGPNLYAYARDNPVRLTDPTGQQSTEDRPSPPDKERTLLRDHRSEIKQAAQALLDARKGKDRIAAFSDDIARQLESVTDAPDDVPLPEVLNLGIARIVQRMVDKARQRRDAGAKGVDFTIVSLTRSTDKEKSPHKKGRGLDIGRYAGKDLSISKGDEQLDAVLKFYSDMIGDAAKGEKPVNARFALGLPRNPRTTGEGAVTDATKADKRHMYDWDIIPGYGPKPALKREFRFDDVFFDRNETPNNAPEIKGSKKSLLNQNITLLQPAAAQGFADLQKLDTTGILRFLMPDGINHFHVQSPP